jgi:N-acetylgalactosamine-N,N'-diacetylbacillosaminyl-diphospho-undecaprenol 4-alpha-N-acetylgalactosaminyltransferase
LNVSEKKQPRICIVSDQLATGGAERCAATLSIFFEKNNCKVHHVIVVDKIEYDFAGEVLNLGKLKNQSNGFYNRIKRFKALKQFFKKIKFDYIIDFRVKRFALQEFYIAKYIYKSPLIVTVHSFMTNLYFPKSKLLANTIYSHCYKIVAVSKSITDKIKSEFSYSNIETIYNPIDFNAIEKASNEDLKLNYKYILAVGRMQDSVKQFDVLIDCYASSNLPKQNIKLVLLGDGLLKKTLENQVTKLNLEDFILFEGKVANPFPYYKQSLYTVLTSKNEGFPTVLLESLACETPVVAFDCFSGPSEIIIDQENGILVENQNQEKLIAAMNEMASNDELYNNCKANAKTSVNRFSIEAIGNQWLKLMKIH